MPKGKKPLVIVTRKLPDSVETRMRELFDTRLNLEDKPMTQAQLGEALKAADVLVPTVTDRIDAPVLKEAGPNLKLIANFGNGVDNIDVAAAVQRGITVTNTPGVLTEDTADMTMALILAVPRRLAEGANVLSGGDKDWPGWSPTWMLGHRIWGKRLGIIGMGRIGQAVARRAAAFGLQIHYHNRRRVAGTDRGRAERHLLGEPRPDARPHGHHLDQLPAHAGDVPPALGAPAEAASPAGLCGQHRARRGDRRERADPHDRGRRTCRRRPRRVRARARGQSEARPARPRRQGGAAAAHGLGHVEGRIDMGEKVIVNIRTFMDGHKPPDRVLPSML